MKFFIPKLSDAIKAENCYQDLKTKIQAKSHIPLEKRIFEIDFVYKGKRYTETVGTLSAFDGSIVVAIFDCGDYCLTCTAKTYYHNPMLVQASRKVHFEE